MGNIMSLVPLALYRAFGIINVTYALRNDILDAMYKEVLRLPDKNSSKTQRLRKLNVAFLYHFPMFTTVTEVSKAISTFEKLVPLASNFHKPQILSNLGVSFALRFNFGGDISDVERGLSICIEALQLAEEGHPDMSMILINLGNSYAIRAQLGELSDFDDAVNAHKEAHKSLPEGDPDAARYLGNIGASLMMRFRRSQSLPDLDEAIKTLEEVNRITPEGHPWKPSTLSSLGSALETRFDKFDDAQDLDMAIKAHEDAILRIPMGHPRRANCLYSLGSSYDVRYRRFGKTKDLDQAIKAVEEAATIVPDGDIFKAQCLTDLGVSLATRFAESGHVTDLERSIKAHDEAVQLAADDSVRKGAYLASQGDSFANVFQRYGRDLDLDKAIDSHTKALEHIPDGNRRAAFLASLGDMYAMRFDRYGHDIDLDKAMDMHKDAGQYVPHGDPREDHFLSAISYLHQLRFQRFGDVEDLETAIDIYRSIEQRGLDDHPPNAGILLALSMALATRFRALGANTDIDCAVAACQDAIKITPKNSPQMARLQHCLGFIFGERFDRFGVVSDIDESILAFDKAVEQTPDNAPPKAMSLSCLCLTYVQRFELKRDIQEHDIRDIDKAIAATEKALQLAPSDHPVCLYIQSHRCRAYSNRCRSQWNDVDAEAAIVAGEKSVLLIKPNDAQETMFLINVGNAYLCRFDHLHDTCDMDKAIIHFRNAACCATGSAYEMFKAAVKWADSASRIDDASVIQAYERALELLPRVAWIGLPLAERHRELVKIGSVTRDAAAAAIASGAYGKAAEWLEQGRSIVWNQLLQFRTPIDELREREPGHAARFEKLTRLLELATTRNEARNENVKQRQPIDLVREWNESVESIREIEGFENFLLPKKLPELKSAAHFGPVVLINVHNRRCDALILKNDQDDVMHVPLNNLSIEKAQNLQNTLDAMLAAPGLRVRNGREIASASELDSQSSDGPLKAVLSNLWIWVVRPILDKLSVPVSHQIDERPRIWWCATGPVAFLPLHAAGQYEKNMIGYQLDDFFTSSYTPTLSALIGAQRPINPHDFKLLAIAQPSTLGHRPLPNTTTELARIRNHIGNLPIVSLLGEQATVEHVEDGMKDCNWVHLACHGMQDTNHPLKSALLLHDGKRLELEKIINISLPNADFAFMSACQTAAGNKDLSEEAVHLAAGMLLAGYRGLIATMWSIQDDDAPDIADEVYSYLLKDQQPDRTRAAHALYHAVRHLREKKPDIPFTSWVPFIHIGI